MHEFTMTQMAIGKFLKGKREEKELSQLDIADALNFKNYNYISMIETGRTNIPTKKICNIALTYGFTREYLKVFIKYVEPDVWSIMETILEDEFGEKYVNKLNAEADKLFLELADKYKLPDSFKEIYPQSASSN